MVEHLIAQFRPGSLHIFSSDKAFPSIEWGEESKKQVLFISSSYLSFGH